MKIRNIQKKGVSKMAMTIILILVLLILGLVWYLFFFTENTESELRTLENPVNGLSDEEAVNLFDEGFVEYLSYEIGADDLHNPPFSKDTPEIEFNVEGEVYNVEVVRNSIIVDVGPIEDEDLLITTTKLEAVKMLRDQRHVIDSFNSGASKIVLIAGKVELLAKGYLEIYTKLTGEEQIS